MELFSVSKESNRLIDCYPKPSFLLTLLRGMPVNEKEGSIRLWISEGIPFAFRENPMLFEIIRAWIAERLKIHPKSITIVGSGRIGFSMKATSFGRSFGPSSDMDFSIISENIFYKLKEEFEKWKTEYETLTIKPENYDEIKYWPLNKELVPKNISRGFLDSNKVPSRRRYPWARRLKRTIEILEHNLTLPQFMNLKIKISKIRVYIGWSSFIRQRLLSLEDTLNRLS